MIDAFAHLEITEADPLADLEMRLTEAGLDRALLVETWDGANRHLLEDLTRSHHPRFLLGLCCRVERSPRPDPLLENSAVTALRIGCSQIAGANTWLEAVSALDKLLLLHSDTGLQDLISELIPVVKRYPRMRMYVPHLGWLDHERIQE